MATSAPRTASTPTQTGKAGDDQTAIGHDASSMSHTRIKSMHAAPHTQKPGHTMPASANGVMSRVKTGMASRFASKPTSDIC